MAGVIALREFMDAVAESERLRRAWPATAEEAYVLLDKIAAEFIAEANRRKLPKTRIPRKGNKQLPDIVGWEVRPRDAHYLGRIFVTEDGSILGNNRDVAKTLQHLAWFLVTGHTDTDWGGVERPQSETTG